MTPGLAAAFGANPKTKSLLVPFAPGRERLPLIVPRVLLLLCLLLLLGLAPEPQRATGTQTILLLDVVINGAPIDIICNFTLFPGGLIGTTKAELAAMGLHGDARPDGDGIVMLNDFPTLKYSYEERRQRIRITVDNRYRDAQTIDLHDGLAQRAPHPQANLGAVLNYDVFASLERAKAGHVVNTAAVSALLEGRIFAPIGTFSQTAALRMGETGEAPLARLDSALRWSDPDTLISATAGDTITGGLWWSRPIRIGGLQGQTNFSLRPDLVTVPLPSLSGTAAVPSTIDIYVNSIHTYSQDVGAGPFTLTNIPMVTGAGNAQVVVRDASGHASATSIPFFGSIILLAPGLDSWSVEAGLPRLFYGGNDDRYDETPVGAATWRRGVLRWLTVEAHGEGGAGIGSGGGGVAVRIGDLGVASIDGAGSKGGGGTGGQIDASFETSLRGFNLSVATQRAYGDFEDLASVTAEHGITAAGTIANFAAWHRTAGSEPFLGVNRVPRAIDRATFGGRVPFDSDAGWSISLVHQRDTDGIVSSIGSVSYSRALPWNASAFASAYRDFGSQRSTGVVFGLSIPLGPKASVSASLTDAEGITGSLAASRPLDIAPGSFGWQAQDTEGVAPYRSASASYRAGVATVQAGIAESRSSLGGTMEVSGAIAAMAHDVFFANRITDAFAVVDAGAPNVGVAYENQFVGKTDSQGELMVVGLRSYEQNRISIDPSGLPVDAEVSNTRQIVTPADRAGALVVMQYRKNVRAALVTFTRPDGSAVPAGAWGQREGGAEFLIGYDGQAFLQDLETINRVVIHADGATCHAAFAFKAIAGTQVRIGPLTCR